MTQIYIRYTFYKIGLCALKTSRLSFQPSLYLYFPAVSICYFTWIWEKR